MTLESQPKPNASARGFVSPSSIKQPPPWAAASWDALPASHPPPELWEGSGDAGWGRHGGEGSV